MGICSSFLADDTSYSSGITYSSGVCGLGLVVAVFFNDGSISVIEELCCCAGFYGLDSFASCTISFKSLTTTGI